MRGVAVVQLQQRVVGGTDELEYTTVEIVEHFHSRRALKRPRLPMHLGFEFDSAELTPHVRDNLDEMARALVHPLLGGQRVSIEGHTDDRGEKEYNLELSKKRAEAVANYLSSAGVQSSRLVAKGFGDKRPLVPNLTPGNRARNRRVQFIIKQQEK